MNSTPITAEQRHALGEIVEKGNIVNVDDRTYLMVQVTPLMVDFLKAIKLEGRENGFTGSQAESFKTPPDAAAPEDDLGLTLTSLYQEFKEDRERGWSKVTLYGYDRMFGTVSGVLGPWKIIREIDRNDMLKVKKVMINIPAHYPKCLTRVHLENADQLSAELALPKRTHATINTDLQRVCTLFEWAANQWYIDRNPTVNLKLPPKRDKAENRRRPFSDAQLQTIFSAPLYTGCVDGQRGYKRPGPNRPRGYRFWVALIALFSGLRLKEICQLDLEDVRKVNEVDCFVISEESDHPNSNKKLKTSSGQRMIPVHSELLKIGILAYVNNLRKQNYTKLFPTFKIRTSGTSTDLYSTWFNERFLVSIGAKEERTSFHSFRHNFRDALREAEVSLDVVRILGGWSRSRYGFEGTYGNGLRIATLKREIEKVRYPGLDLSHLYEE